MMIDVGDYFPSAEWQRNYGAMTDDKLLRVLGEFEDAKRYGGNMALYCEAVQRVMDHNGDVDENYERCRREALNRGLRIMA